ncbi:Rhodanese-like domain-containing protein [Chytriomyces sp. MP71]|nr:Rhodanese-like domain-containing protein [Chytriomyces sp. MP71]
MRLVDASFHVPVSQRAPVEGGASRVSAREKVRSWFGMGTDVQLEADLSDPRIVKQLQRSDDEVKNAEYRNAKSEFAQKHIENAVFLDFVVVRDVLRSLPLAMPHHEDFGAFMDDLGILRTDHVVVYDTIGTHTSPRAWWILKAMGHQNVSVMDGGLPAWNQEGLPIISSSASETNDTSALPSLEPEYAAAPNLGMVVEYARMYEVALDLTASNAPVIIDCRSLERHLGRGIEPILQIKKSGTVPGAVNIHWTEFLDRHKSRTDGSEYTTLKHPMDIIRVFKERGRNVNLDRDIVVFGHDGISASVVCLCLHVLGKETGVSLYDGGWMEWAMRDQSPVTRKAD